MSEYTAEDFAAAQFALYPRGMSRAQRHLVRWNEGDRPWNNGFGGPISTEELVDAGCIPVYAEPYSPEALQRAWEHGEKPKSGEVSEEGVSYIWRDGKGRCTLFADGSRSPLLPSERIVYRPSATKHATERNPVADLAQALEDVLPEEAGSPVALRRYAAALAEYGVRVVADDE